MLCQKEKGKRLLSWKFPGSVVSSPLITHISPLKMTPEAKVAPLAHSLSCFSSSPFTSPSRPAGGVFRLQLLLPVQLRGVRLRLLRVPLQRGRVAGGCPTPAATRPICPVSVRRRDQQPVSVLPVVSTAADCWFCRLPDFF